MTICFGGSAKQRGTEMAISSHQRRWTATETAIEKDIPGFEVGYKDQDTGQKLLGKLVFWTKYTNYVTTVYPKVFFRNRSSVEGRWPWWVLQHEWVHLKDTKTFFGKMPWMPTLVNKLLFAFLYGFPQWLGLLGFLGFVHWGFFFAFLLFAPLPAPFRAWIELRAYRRSVELGDTAERIAHNFTGPGYYFMWPFRKMVTKLLKKPSPYKAEMDRATS